MKKKIVVTTIMTALVFSCISNAFGAEGSPTEELYPPVTLDIEIDPVAYALGGYSVHGGIGWRRFRVDLGAFGMELPEWAHKNEGFSARFGGYGMKVQYFLMDRQGGPFLGASAGVLLPVVTLKDTEFAATFRQFNAGLQAGWRVEIGAGFFLTPWVGVDYNFGAPEITLMEQTYEHQQWTFFPTVHLGYRTR